ncbi:hypothetical protein BV360_05428 [Pseudomonas syringae pv. actinidiae]|nr:hypothetical protein BV339_05535 [Pseudomonas syringae pv. actinidiae]OSN12423.1 hypothetical protein BV340_05418 [Pseudomonas syringae pv. actinidiae]OSN14540.1 hypothetical protein BV341_05450 [Pseudomonas syringae pv. actinidiae]OSN26914.1 hypothetical protein BV343_05481 [Pseudomonas syringae pv. actinidiae]OSN29448.1 hypothetical protein BV342_05500 [Pseudomonas syringae pv. actinidiae]
MKHNAIFILHIEEVRFKFDRPLPEIGKNVMLNIFTSQIFIKGRFQLNQALTRKVVKIII